MLGLGNLRITEETLEITWKEEAETQDRDGLAQNSTAGERYSEGLNPGS